MEPNLTQKQMILNHLRKHGTIDTWTCIQKYRITRLSQYILLLRNEGFNITDEWIKPKEGNRFKRYFYTKKEPLQQQ